MKKHALTIVGLSFLVLGSPRASGQQTAPLPKLFAQLQSEEKTNGAISEFLQLGPNNTDAKKYLAAHLPALIKQGPEEHPHVWINAVKLAGAFRAPEAVPALIQWIGVPQSESGGSTLAETARLDPFPAGKALVQIGEPAVPSLTQALEKGNTREQWVAYRALFLLRSPSAISALRDHLKNEPDPAFRLEIQRALESK